jgi:uncharacterized SAM-binding protein YcdF (DUF218 family)
MTFEHKSRRLLILLIGFALLAGVATWSFRKLGRWLVDPDALQHARVIVILSGYTPFRAMEAANLYRQGWAPEVWLLRDQSNEADEAFAKLGIPYPSEQDYDQQVLERLGVPKEAIRILDPPTSNTVSEVRLIAGELRREGGDKAIVVTSPLHTRRAKAIWRIVVGDHPQAILRYDTSEPCDPDHWWRATQDVEAVAHEVLGLINTYLGFVAKPRQR